MSSIIRQPIDEEQVPSTSRIVIEQVNSVRDEVESTSGLGENYQGSKGMGADQEQGQYESKDNQQDRDRTN